VSNTSNVIIDLNDTLLMDLTS